MAFVMEAERARIVMTSGAPLCSISSKVNKPLSTSGQRLRVIDQALDFLVHRVVDTGVEHADLKAKCAAGAGRILLSPFDDADEVAKRLDYPPTSSDLSSNREAPSAHRGYPLFPSIIIPAFIAV
jgi:hypothetical protein